MPHSDLGRVKEKIRQEREKVSAKGFAHLRKDEHKQARECGFVLEGLDFAIAAIDKQFEANDPR